MARMWVFTAFVCLLALLEAAFAQTEETVIELKWVEETDRVYPDPLKDIETNQSMTLRLTGKSEISQRTSTRSGRYGGNTHNTMVLGQGWRVVGTSTLQNAQEYPQHHRILSVTVSGQSCRLSVVHRLKPGQTQFITPMSSRPGKAGRYVRLRATSASCTIR
jgi:hypothetical protein